MIIRAYAGLPRTYAPDVGEVVMARRTPVDQFTRAVVLAARRNKEGGVRVKVQWLADNPDAGASGPKPIVAGTIGWVVAPGIGAPLIKQIDEAP